jgi:hypothetical protein
VRGVGLRSRIRRLEREAEGEMIVIPQQDGTLRRFPPEAAQEALLRLIEGEDHPLAQAARSSPAPEWSNSFFSASPMREVEDLSEQPTREPTLGKGGAFPL